MANKYGISEKDEKEIRARDKACVYCGVKMTPYISEKGSRAKMATIEHFDNDKDLNKKYNIAICCASCNSHRGSQDLLTWFNTEYCIKKNINQKTVANPVKVYLVENKK